MKCDADNNPQSSIDLGIVNVLVGFGTACIPLSSSSFKFSKWPARRRKERAYVPFPANCKRLDPYKNFKWRLKWDGKYVYGGSKLSGLKRTTEVGRNTARAAIPPLRTSHPAVRSSTASRWSVD